MVPLRAFVERLRSIVREGIVKNSAGWGKTAPPVLT